ncbi:MAG: TrkH family potassium uptake protein [Gammaproteobacteria bacterium]|nr:TrkH family potassium uptake protein [Gammaproteobacteria bacterium]
MTANLMNYRTISWVLGSFLAALGGSMLVPYVYSVVTDHHDQTAMLLASLVSAAAAVILLLIGRKRERRDLLHREGILLVSLIWLVICVFGALPFHFSASYPSFTDALFESTSGFTTTGATVIADIDGLSRPLHLWRCFSHWLGGMGIVLLGVAILPLLGQGGNALYRAEFSGAASERMRPRIVESARALWRLYVIFTLAEIVLLMLAGMDLFDAVCHAFSTLGTGGFSTRTASIAGFNSPLIEYIVIVFMFLAGVSFIQHYRFWIEHKPGSVFRDYEFRAYFVLTLVVAGIIAVSLGGSTPLTIEQSIRTALFQVVSILSTTGFVTADYGLWPPLLQLLIVVLMFTGGCTGSTAGGLKVARVMLMLHVVKRDFRRLAEPQGVFRIRVSGDVLPELAVTGLLNLVFLALMVLLLASLLVSATGVDIVSSVTSVIACQFNIGPGLGAVGPMSNYGELAPFAKWVLSFCMIAGRLEFYTVLILLTGVFWSR